MDVLRRFVLIVAVSASAVLLASGAGADPQSDKNRVDRQLQETQSTLEAATTRAQQAAAQHDAATAALPGARSVEADAKGQAIGAEVAARQAQRESDAAKLVEDAARTDYDKAAAAVDQGRASVSVFVSAAYKGSGFLMANTIMDAADPTDLATRIGYLEHIAGDRKQALDVLTGARMAAKQRSDVALVARQRADRTARAASKALADAQAAQAAATQATTNVQALIAQTAQAEAVANSERSVVLAKYAQLQRESDEIGRQLRAIGHKKPSSAGSPGGGSAPSEMRPGAFFLMPVRGWKSSNFGMRYDPYYRVYQLHAGVDLAAPGGSPIAAAANGTVVQAGWRGGYGNYTCLSHGDYQGKNLATCYGHQSKILVSIGQRVSRGQIIGRVGTTGASTGYHLHFEVRIDGRPVQPLNWLPGCLC